MGAARLVKQVLDDAGMASAVKTSGAKGVHVFVPLEADAAVEDVAAATRAVAARAERLDPELATTAFVREDRHGKVFLDSTRAGGATVVAAYSPRVRPGVPVSFPVGWDALDDVTPADFTVRTAPALLTTATRGRARCRSRRSSTGAWSRRATPSRSPGSRRCTRASAAVPASGLPKRATPRRDAGPARPDTPNGVATTRFASAQVTVLGRRARPGTAPSVRDMQHTELAST